MLLLLLHLLLLLALLGRPSFGLQHWVLVLRSPVYMIDKVHSIHGVLDLFPSVGQLVLAAIFQ